MPMAKRTRCESEIYHLIARGVGRMNIFEDDDDRAEFLRILGAALRTARLEALAWCLMSNHVHLLVHGPLDQISGAMRGALSSYARFFNLKHGHVGHLFQGRYTSIPVIDDAQLLETVRYIHQNPQAAGICGCREYPWSSYEAYAKGARAQTPTGLPCVTGPVLGMLGGARGFAKFHETEAELDPGQCRKAAAVLLSEAAAKARAEELLGARRLSGLPSLGKAERDEGLCLLKEAGLSVRQIERITGIGRNIIQRASR